MELWDILDQNRMITGQLVERGQPMEPGEFSHFADIWLFEQEIDNLLKKLV